MVDAQVELVESVDGLTARAGRGAGGAAEDRRSSGSSRRPSAASGARLRVSDLPLGDEGVAGYAVDIEEMEEQARSFRAFREAQRQMLDQLSVGVAQFGPDRRLQSANQPFRRSFAMRRGAAAKAPSSSASCARRARRAARPRCAISPRGARERSDWFAADDPVEEAWPLTDGTHLRVVAQPMPDGGLVLIAEDRTESLALSATRDTLLRTRTATFDSLFEALAVFAPDGHMQLWNRRFAAAWGLAHECARRAPDASTQLLEQIAPLLAKPRQAKAIGEVVRGATLDRKQTRRARARSPTGARSKSRACRCPTATAC